MSCIKKLSKKVYKSSYKTELNESGIKIKFRSNYKNFKIFENIIESKHNLFLQFILK